jgi:hypothetical protein
MRTQTTALQSIAAAVSPTVESPERQRAAPRLPVITAVAAIIAVLLASGLAVAINLS